ncbi:MAG: NAD(P)-dependent oxidoreductase [Caulobacteraceae bacterium]
MSTFLVTGGAGFLGSLLIQRLLRDGHQVTNIDRVASAIQHHRMRSVVGDIRDRGLLDNLLSDTDHQAVFHCAALLAHGSYDKEDLWSSNVEGTRTLAEAVAAAGVRNVVYLSSNCLWGTSFSRPVRETDAPAPVELYGVSKWEGEKILSSYADRFTTATIRCPTIIDEGRLGLLSILFEFISEGRRVWVVGDGSNHYQFIYAGDLIEAMIAAVGLERPQIFGIGSDQVLSMRKTYEYVIANSGSRSKVGSLPQGPTIAAMKAAHLLRLSPLGPYHYRMIASDFMFDTSKIKAVLGWRPTLSNHEMLLRAFRYYKANRAEIYSRSSASAHHTPASPGVIRLLKWVS